MGEGMPYDEDAAIDRERENRSLVLGEEGREVRATSEEAHSQWPLSDQHVTISIPRRMAAADSE